MACKRFLLLVVIALLAKGVIAAGSSAKDMPGEMATPVEVVVQTSLGSFTLELYPAKAPETVANFLAYVDEGFYENTIFHRVIPGFVIQGGGFEKGLKAKQTREPVENESRNRLKNARETISMARKTHPDSATSQFFINLADNARLDWKAEHQPGYTVFGKVTEGMEVIDKIAGIPTKTVDGIKDVPTQDVLVLSATRMIPKLAQKSGASVDSPGLGEFVAGEHYVVLDRPVPTRDGSRIEVVEMFSYGCPHCYEFESLIKEWLDRQPDDVDFWSFPAVWNKPMKLYARAFYAARQLNVDEKIHHPLFEAIVIEQKRISDESDLAEFFSAHGVDKDAFVKAFNSAEVETKVNHSEERIRLYNPVGVPEIVVNGKYRVDRMRGGGLAEMLLVVDFLIEKERALQEN